MTEEERRAADHRAQQVRRVAFQLQQQKLLKGEPVARRTLQARWQPFLDSLPDRNRRIL